MDAEQELQALAAGRRAHAEQTEEARGLDLTDGLTREWLASCRRSVAFLSMVDRSCCGEDED